MRDISFKYNRRGPINKAIITINDGSIIIHATLSSYQQLEKEHPLLIQHHIIQFLHW